MSQIALTINGRKRNVNLALLNWARAQEINTAHSGGTSLTALNSSTQNCLCSGTLQNVPTGLDTNFYVFKTAYSTAALVTDLVDISAQKGSRVLYFGANQKTGDHMRDFFKSPSLFPDLPTLTPDQVIDPYDPNQIVFSSLQTAVYDQFPIYKAASSQSTIDNYKVCYNACAVIQTDTGGRFGASLCMGYGSNANGIYIHSFGAWKYLLYLGDGIAANGNQAYGGKPWGPYYGGQAILPYTSSDRSWNAAVKSAGVYDGTADPTLYDDITAEMVYSEIGGKPYLGLAACRWSGGTIAQIEVTMLPAWFWGDYDTPSDPADTPQYHGRDAVPQRTSGSYTYTPNSVDLPTAYQPVSSVSDVAFGLHVYRISDADYMNIQQTLWGKGTLSDSLWNRWNNYKFNPIAGIIGCHVLPKAFMPDVTGMSYSQPRAAGCGLVSTGQSYHVNGQTTITDSASTVNMPEYFSSHLNWDPYTSVQLFLPFCGWISIPADRCIDTKDGSTGSISIQYRCDIITGNVCCFVRCFNADGVNTYSTMATGNAAISVPITGNDNGTGQIVGAITAGAGLAVGALTGVGGLALAAGATGAGLAVNTARHTMQSGSTYSGNVAALGCLQPYLLITMPVEHTSETWRELHGLPSGLGLTVGDLTGTGYTEMSEIHAEIGCTAEEQAEIEALMKAGVIL